MAMTFPVGGGGGDFKRVPPGTHIAVCNMVADMGMQPGSQMFPDPKRKLVIRWEVQSERVEYEKDGKTVEGPLTINGTYTASMNEKANLRKLLEAWRGRKFTDEQAATFDVSSILGAACLINVSETDKGDATYSNVVGASPLMKGMDAPKAENALLYYGDDNKAGFNDLPKWIQEKIQNQLMVASSEQELDDRRAEQFLDDDPFADDKVPF